MISSAISTSPLLSRCENSRTKRSMDPPSISLPDLNDLTDAHKKRRWAPYDPDFAAAKFLLSNISLNSDDHDYDETRSTASSDSAARSFMVVSSESSSDQDDTHLHSPMRITNVDHEARHDSTIVDCAAVYESGRAPEATVGHFVHVTDFAAHLANGAVTLEFEQLNNTTTTPVFFKAHGGMKAGKTEANSVQNRHPIPPFTNNTVSLFTATHSSDPDAHPNNSYINASPITNAFTMETDTTHIATQAPLPETIAKFWEMILQVESPIIVALSAVAPGQCDQYWPSQVGDVSQYWFPNSTEEYVEVKLNSEGPLALQCSCIVRRSLSIRLFRGEEIVAKMTTTQFHHTTWGDHTAPEDLGALIMLLDAVEAARQSSSFKTPVVVHCSAGVGRCGTFIAADQACTVSRALCHGDSERGLGLGLGFNLQHLVYKLRCQRPMMVYKAEQYLSLYLIVYRYCTGEDLTC